MKCERCGRNIRGQGRCLPCNYFYKHKKYFKGLKIADEYDKKHGMDIELVHNIISEKKLSFKDNKKVLNKKNIVNGKEFNEKRCLRCQFVLKDRKHLYCTECFRFLNKNIHIRNYKDFLNEFELKDNSESKEKYIQFVDDMNKFYDLQDFSIDDVLDNPKKYLDKISN